MYLHSSGDDHQIRSNFRTASCGLSEVEDCTSYQLTSSYRCFGSDSLTILPTCYRLDDVVPDIAFCLIAATLERGVLENHFSNLKTTIPGPSESLVVIAFLIINLQRESLGEIREFLARPQLSLIPFKDLLGETPSLLSGRNSMKHFSRHLQSLISTSFLGGQWYGVYLRD